MTVVWSNPEATRRRLSAEADRIIEALSKRGDVDQVWLFGSLIKGDLHETSDVDLLVVQRTSTGVAGRGFRLATELGPRVAVDLFVYTPEEFAAGGRFVRHVLRQGRRVL